jgi:DNA invertase Pin-like site-specific DNA recombinase
MRLVPYLRVSTVGQVEDGGGLTDQLEAIQAWADRNGHELTEPFSDKGISGAKGLDDRPQLVDALELVKAREADGLVVSNLTRLARKAELQEWLFAEIKRLGGQLFSTSEAENQGLKADSNDPAAPMIRTILGAVAEYERMMIVQRMRVARERKRRLGGYAGHGSPAFGKRSNGDALVDDENEIAAVNRIRTLKAEGLSFGQIITTLNREGFRPKRGGQWHANTVSRILSRNAPEMVKRRNRASTSTQ